MAKHVYVPNRFIRPYTFKWYEILWNTLSQNKGYKLSLEQDNITDANSLAKVYFNNMMFSDDSDVTRSASEKTGFTNIKLGKFKDIIFNKKYHFDLREEDELTHYLKQCNIDPAITYNDASKDAMLLALKQCVLDREFRDNQPQDNRAKCLYKIDINADNYTITVDTSTEYGTYYTQATTGGEIFTWIREPIVIKFSSSSNETFELPPL